MGREWDFLIPEDVRHTSGIAMRLIHSGTQQSPLANRLSGINEDRIEQDERCALYY